MTPNPDYPRCRTCRAPIAWVRTVAGKRMPVDWSSLSEIDRRALRRGEGVTFDQQRGHVSHFATCAQADQHRRPRAPAVPRAEELLRQLLEAIRAGGFTHNERTAAAIDATHRYLADQAALRRNRT